MTQLPELQRQVSDEKVGGGRPTSLPKKDAGSFLVKRCERGEPPSILTFYFWEGPYNKLASRKMACEIETGHREGHF